MKYLIYGLLDPRTDELFYVGKSSSGMKRVIAHGQPYNLSKNASTAERERITAIMEAGFTGPVPVILASCKNAKQLAMAERVMIARYREHYQLVNIHGNRPKYTRTDIIK